MEEKDYNVLHSIATHESLDEEGIYLINHLKNTKEAKRIIIYLESNGFIEPGPSYTGVPQQYQLTRRGEFALDGYNNALAKKNKTLHYLPILKIIKDYNISYPNTIKDGIKRRRLEEMNPPINNLVETLNEMMSDCLLEDASTRLDVPKYRITEKGRTFFDNDGDISNTISPIQNKFENCIINSPQNITINLTADKFFNHVQQYIEKSEAPPEEKSKLLENIGSIAKNPWVVQAVLEAFKWADNLPIK